MKRNIVLDLDGVIADIGGAIERHLKEKYDYSDWLITDSKDDKAMDVFNNPLFWKNMKPYEDAWHQTNYWFNEGYDVHIVTARRCEAAIKQTQPWLDFWRINTLAPVFTNIHEKHTVIEKLDPIFVVEDNPNEVSLLKKEGINVFLRKQWYNQEFWDTLPTIDNLYNLELN
jgi:hypothetical protein